MQLEESNRALQQEIAERRRAEALLLRSEEAQRQLAETRSAILNALQAHVALVDSDGTIVSVNESWRRFATSNSLQDSNFCVGQNYLEIFEKAHGDSSEGAQAAALGLRRVLRGETMEFASEYPCHSPAEQRWFHASPPSPARRMP